MRLCKQLGKTLHELRLTVTEKELQLWYCLELVEEDERKQEQVNREVLNDFQNNKGKYTSGF